MRFLTRCSVLAASLLMALPSAGVAGAMLPLEAWRGEVVRTRLLAENNPEAAQAQIRKLSEAMPAGVLPADRARVLNAMARVENYLALSAQADAHAASALETAQSASDKIGQAEARLNQVLSAINLGKIDEMTEASLESVELLEDGGRPDLLAEAMLRASMVTRRQDQTDDSAILALRTLDRAKQGKDATALAYAYWGVAVSYGHSEHPDEARDYYLLMLEMARAAPSAMLEAQALRGLAAESDRLGEKRQAERLMRETVELARKLKSPFTLSNALIGLAGILEGQRRHAEAHPLLNEAVAIYDRYENPIGSWFALKSLGGLHLAMGKLEVAETDAARAKAVAHKIGLPRYEAESLRWQGDVAAARGDYRRAYEFASQATALAERETREQSAKRILALAQRYEIESKQRNLDEMAAELERDKWRHRLLWAIIAGCMLALLVGAFFMLRLRRSRDEIGSLNAGLELREREFRSLVENSPDAVARFDEAARCIYANPAFLRGAGLSGELVIGRRAAQMPLESGGMAVYENRIADVLASGEEQELRLEWRRRGGEEACTDIRLIPERGRDGRVGSVLSVGRDISQLKDTERRLNHLATHDALTGLPNRALFQDRLQQAIAMSDRHGCRAALMLLDLDNFKTINDTLGHSVGDALLKQVASAMRAVLREGDTVARLGGDEFVVVMQDVTGDEDLDIVAAKILAAVARPLQVRENQLLVNASMGIAVYPGDGGDGEVLLRNADTAMYAAKEQGRNGYRYFSEEMNIDREERLVLAAGIRQALDAGEFELHYQPKVALQDGALSGMEALIRWRHPLHGMIPPGRFIPVAEEHGLIGEIGEWVIGAAARQLRAWLDAGLEPPAVAVNLSAAQCRSGEIVGLAERVLGENRLAGRYLEVEITESMVMHDAEKAVDIFWKLKEMGIGVAIDDFGTGHSSLSYLKRFPIDCLKIDKSFVDDIETDKNDAEIVCAIVSLAHSLGMHVVAEGVETREQMIFLRDNGCEEVQGYYFSKPLPAAEMTRLLRHPRFEVQG